ncbi:hypothetical protein EYF80_002331 [Liparis tanakae]|uniref:Uncharacterized protein n=1 Tax=Liparis tanakae TaxID=230148 RepID=A0A4Z2JA79_9TELE|nr:hypothetical protein EYF80_002331 [Liparis tanakae]
MPALFKSAQWVRPNCLHVLLTPQSPDERHKGREQAQSFHSKSIWLSLCCCSQSELIFLVHQD